MYIFYNVQLFPPRICHFIPRYVIFFLGKQFSFTHGFSFLSGKRLISLISVAEHFVCRGTSRTFLQGELAHSLGVQWQVSWCFHHTLDYVHSPKKGKYVYSRIKVVLCNVVWVRITDFIKSKVCHLSRKYFCYVVCPEYYHIVGDKYFLPIPLRCIARSYVMASNKYHY